MEDVITGEIKIGDFIDQQIDRYRIVKPKSRSVDQEMAWILGSIVLKKEAQGQMEVVSENSASKLGMSITIHVKIMEGKFGK